MNNILEITSPAPILNTPDFHVAFGGVDGSQIPRNSLGHPLHYEFVALPGMRVSVEEILSRHHHCIYRINTPTYSAPALFLDSRFAKPAHANPTTPISFPTRELLAKKMEALLGVPYVWGGNWSAGIPELLHLYPPRGAIDATIQTLWTLKGIDCSGLLYETAEGLTPRNSSDLVYFGKPVQIERLSFQQLANQLLPMDMVVWPGHLWFVLNKGFSIESKSPFGVIKRPLIERIEEVCRERRGVNEWTPQLDPNTHFTIRRFIGSP